MQEQSHQKFYEIEVLLDSGETKVVPVKAASQEAAEHRALKRTSNGVSIKRTN